jgi:hypothetical protein
LTVTDDVGDGICCDYGEGDFRILDTNSDTLLEGNGSFTYSVSDDFCVNWVGIGEVQGTNMRVAPNPSHGSFTAYLPRTGTTTALHVQDPVGRVVWTGSLPAGTDRAELDLSRLSAGWYLLVAESGGQRSVQRIIVQH